jgi:hypothetical protein
LEEADDSAGLRAGAADVKVAWRWVWRMTRAADVGKIWWKDQANSGISWWQEGLTVVTDDDKDSWCWMQLRKGPGQQWQELIDMGRRRCAWEADDKLMMGETEDKGCWWWEQLVTRPFDYRSISPKLLVSAATYESCCGGEQLLRDATDDEITAVGVGRGGGLKQLEILYNMFVRTKIQRMDYYMQMGAAPRWCSQSTSDHR